MSASVAATWVGTAVLIYDDAVLEEVSEEAPPGATPDLIMVPDELLAIRPRDQAARG